MATKSDRPKKEASEHLPVTGRAVKLKVIICVHCQKKVAYHLKDCPWCGTSLVFGRLAEG